ncbi:MAG: diguanylate cyclase [Motiliproteus sp.]
MLAHLLERIDHHQFESLSNDIKRSLNEHLKWLHELTAALVLQRPLKDDAFVAEDAHLHCKFGRWIRHLLEDEAFNQKVFIELDRSHQQLHVTARTMMDKLNRAVPVDADELESFLQLQRSFFDSMQAIFEFSVVNKHQFDLTTKLMNRRSVDTVLANEKHRMERVEDSHCCVVIADIDRFKAFNDGYGHDVGDRVLQHTAAVFHGAIRRHDTVARFGGEEFLFVLPDMDLANAILASERIRRALAVSSIDHLDQSLSVTASFGVTQLCRTCDIKQSVKRADVALYRAKALGRNCTVSVDVADVSKAVGAVEARGDSVSESLRIQMIGESCQRIT